MKKGFTLVELIGVIVLLGLIALITIPVVDNVIKKNNENSYNDQIRLIKLSAEDWVNENNINLDDGDLITITLLQLKQANLVEKDIKNPKTNKLFHNDLLINITKTNGIVSYDVVDSDSTYDNYDNAPSIILNGKTFDEVNLGDTYVDQGVVAKSSTGSVLSDVTVEPSTISTSSLTIYKITYSVTDSGITSKVIRNVKVVDKEYPVIDLLEKETTISLSEVSTFNILSGIVATDNSGEAKLSYEGEIKESIGKYTITYIAIDESGNKSTKNRIINVTE